MRTLGWDGTEYAYMTVHGYKTVLRAWGFTSTVGRRVLWIFGPLKESCDFFTLALAYNSYFLKIPELGRHLSSGVLHLSHRRA